MTGSNDTRGTRNRNTGTCRWDVFVNLCEEAKLALEEAMLKAGCGGDQPGRQLRRMKNGIKIEIWMFEQLATVLRCNPESLYIQAKEETSSPESAAYRYAQRIDQLLREEVIPKRDRDNNPTDIASYLWHSGDHLLDSMQLTDSDRRSAYFLLRDHFLRLVERPAEIMQPRQAVIGVMHYGQLSIDDILADVDARLGFSTAALEVLQDQYHSGVKSNDAGLLRHIKRIRATIDERWESYDRAQFKDNTLWEKQSELNCITRQSVWAVVEADRAIRQIIFPTQEQDEAFFLLYRRSSRLIEQVMDRNATVFPAWWQAFRDDNTRFVRAFYQAWGTHSSDAAPEWDEMKGSLRRTLENTRTAIYQHLATVKKADEQ